MNPLRMCRIHPWIRAHCECCHRARLHVFIMPLLLLLYCAVPLPIAVCVFLSFVVSVFLHHFRAGRLFYWIVEPTIMRLIFYILFVPFHSIVQNKNQTTNKYVGNDIV